MFLEKLDKENLPKHVAITMDGNGRWAKPKENSGFLDMKMV